MSKKQDILKWLQEIDNYQFQIHAYSIGMQDAGLLMDRNISKALDSYTGRMSGCISMLRGIIATLPESDQTSNDSSDS